MTKAIFTEDEALARERGLQACVSEEAEQSANMHTHTHAHDK